MGPNSSDLPTPPEMPILPSQPIWPSSLGSQPPSSRPPWTLFAIIAALVIVALLVGVLFLARGGTPTAAGGLAASQTATSASAQVTASAVTGSTVTANPVASATPAPSPTSAPTATTPPQPPAVHFVVAQATVSTSTPVVAQCPSGELALSGGWASNGSTPIYNSSRSGDGWRVFPYTSGALTNAYVMCLQNDPGASITELASHITIASGAIGNANIPCNAGEVVVGGGYANPTPGVEIYNFTASGNGWGGYAVNHTSSAAVVTFYAECLNASGAHTTFTSPVTTSIGAGSTGGTQVSCPGGSLLSGGGFADDENALVYNSSPNSSSTWEVYLKNQGASSTGLNVYAMCLSFS
jgi:hypothetical protein